MIRRGYSLGCVLAVLGLVTMGCDNSTATDAGVDSGSLDGGNVDSGPVDSGPASPVLMAFDGTDLIAADLTCLGTRTAPTPGAAMDFPVRTVARGVTDAPAPNVTVQLFASNMVPNDDDTCGTGCVPFTSDASGLGTINLLEDAWFAYRVIGIPMMTKTVVAYNDDTDLSAYTTGATEAIEFSQIGQALFDAAIGAGSVTVQDGTGQITGDVYDCAGNELVNARLRVFSPSAEIVGGTARTGPRYVYWAPGGVFPSATLTATTTEGRYAGANIPWEATIRVEMWGVIVEGEAESMIACEEIGGAGDRLTLLNISPARSDGPSTCSE